MKKYLLISLYAYVIPVFAQSKIVPPTGNKPLEVIIADIVGVVQILLIMATVLYLIYAGLMFVTARGEPGKITKARDALLWGMVGAGLILGAQILVNALKSSVGQILN